MATAPPILSTHPRAIMMTTTAARTSAILLAAAAGLALAAPALAQTAPLQSREVPWRADSGPVSAPVKAAGAQVVYQTVVFVPNAPWLRLTFGKVQLAGTIEEGSGSYLRITSLADGGVQYLNAVSAQQWGNTSAYLNGDAVLVELLAYPGAGASRVSIAAATAGLETVGGADSICGPTDDRTLLNDARTARHVPEGCTTWLFNDTNHMFLTAGHCGISANDVQQFNVPLSTSSGSLVAPPPEDQYAVDPASIRSNGGLGIGNDYCYFACFTNSNTGQTAYQRQGQFYTLSATSPPVAGQTIRITGYGTTGSGVLREWNQVGKTHTGPYVTPTTGAAGTTVSYQVDTTGGNSGSPVHNLATDQAIGIHTHAGCSTTSGNNGTAIQLGTLQTALATPIGLALTGRGTVNPPLYAAGDGANNFGTCNMVTGNFARVNDGPVRMEGLTYNWNSGLFYGINNDTFAPTAGRKLYTINPATGAATLIGTVSGASGVINGLGYNPAANVLYGIIQATGQIVTINTTTAVATNVGPAHGGTIGALEFDPGTGALFGIDDAGGASTLVKWTDPTQARVVVGNLGAGITDCNGLAVVDSGDLYTINAVNRQLLKINPATGTATVVGATGGIFGASYGMAAVLTPVAPSCYANCDGSSIPPILNVSDFTCFLNRYSAGDSYANCDGSTVPPVLNVSDFTCFLNAYSAGCS